MEKFVQKILKVLAVITLHKYSPGVIGVTGSVGKTSTKEAIFAVLKNFRRVRVSPGNFNGEVGLPLTILGDYSWEEVKIFSREYPPKANRLKKSLFLLKITVQSISQLIFKNRMNYPELLILEYGADKPRDIKNLLDIVKPQIAVITAIGEIPAHVEFYSGPEAVAREKGRLIENLSTNGFAVLNADDEAVMDLKERTRAHAVTFGFSEEAEMRVTNFDNRIENGVPRGVSFKFEYGGSFVPVRLDDCFGKAVALSAAAAALVGIAFGMHLVRIAESLASFRPPSHRMNLIMGIKGTRIIDDSYNASPLSMAAAIETVKSLPASRKMAVLGDMLEIGAYSAEAHENIGKLAAKVFDVLVAVGLRAKFIAAAAREQGFDKNSIFEYDTAEAARLPIQDLIKTGDLILIKASRALALDKIVEEIKQME